MTHRRMAQKNAMLLLSNRTRLLALLVTTAIGAMAQSIDSAATTPIETIETDMHDRLLEIAGPNAKDCGIVMVRTLAISKDAIDRAADCAEEAHTANQPFIVQYLIPVGKDAFSKGYATGVDSILYHVYVGAASGNPLQTSTNRCEKSTRLARNGWNMIRCNDEAMAEANAANPSSAAKGAFGLGSDYHAWESAISTGPVYKTGGNISNPVIKYAPDPEFSEEARRAHYQGVVVVGLIVDDKGNPQKVHVVRTLGMGLDAEALNAVRHYKFKPALKDGKRPVPVSINIEVNFRIWSGYPPRPIPEAGGNGTGHSDLLDTWMRQIAGKDAKECGTVPIDGDPAVARACANTAISKNRPFFVRFREPGIDSNASVAFAASHDGKVLQIGLRDGQLSERECPAPVQLWGMENEVPDCFLADMAAACKGKNASATIPSDTLKALQQAANTAHFEEVIRIAGEPNSGLRVLWIIRGKSGRILSYGIGNKEGCTVSQMQMYDAE